MTTSKTLVKAAVSSIVLPTLKPTDCFLSFVLLCEVPESAPVKQKLNKAATTLMPFSHRVPLSPRKGCFNMAFACGTCSNFHTERKAHPRKNILGGQRQQVGEGSRGAEGRCRAASSPSRSSVLITDQSRRPQAELDETLVVLMLREREVTKVSPFVWM